MRRIIKTMLPLLQRTLLSKLYDLLSTRIDNVEHTLFRDYVQAHFTYARFYLSLFKAKKPQKEQLNRYDLAEADVVKALMSNGVLMGYYKAQGEKGRESLLILAKLQEQLHEARQLHQYAKLERAGIQAPSEIN